MQMQTETPREAPSVKSAGAGEKQNNTNIPAKTLMNKHSINKKCLHLARPNVNIPPLFSFSNNMINNKVDWNQSEVRFFDCYFLSFNNTDMSFTTYYSA